MAQELGTLHLSITMNVIRSIECGITTVKTEPLPLAGACGKIPDLPRSELDLFLQRKFPGRGWDPRHRHQLIKFMYDMGSQVTESWRGAA